jgi:hypothetical protein
MVNYLAIVVASVASFVLGMLWYSPLVLGNIWMKLEKLTKKDMEAAKKRGMAKPMFFNAVSLLVTAYVLNYLMDLTSLHGSILGFWAWIGFVATVSMAPVLWKGQSWNLYLFNNAHTLVSFLLMGLVLSLF